MHNCETCPKSPANWPDTIDPLLARLTSHQRVDLQIALCDSQGCRDDLDISIDFSYGITTSPYLDEALQIISAPTRN